MKASRSGFTLIEVTMAMVVVSVMGLTVAGVAMALSTAQDNSQDYYQCIQTGRVTMLRLQDMFRRARLVTGASDTGLVIWDSDANGDRTINVTELKLVSWDESTQRVTRRCVKAPQEWSEAMKNLPVPLYTATFQSWSTWQSNFESLIEEVTLAENVEAFSVQTTSAAPLAKSVSIQMTIRLGDHSLTIRGGASLRADWTDRVENVDGHYILLP